MDGRAAPQIGQAKGCLAVAAVGGAQQRIEGLVLCNGEKLALTPGPSTRGKIEGHHTNLTQKGFRHRSYLLGNRRLWSWINAIQCDDE